MASFVVSLLLSLWFISSVFALTEQEILSQLRVPEGFTIEVFARDVPNARSMTRSPNGTIYVGTRRAGNVYALPDRNGDARPDTLIIIASGLNMPNGVAFHNGALYVAEVNRVLRFDNIEDHLDAVPSPVVVSETYPSDAWHGWKYIAFGPDGKLYIPVGAPCNVCERPEPVYASITRMQVDGSNREIIATGVHKTVGFDWHPVTGKLWFTDNGRDMMGDDIPPCEINVAQEDGLFFGFPYVHGRNVVDPEFGAKLGKRKVTLPALELQAHVAPLALKFYTGSSFPAEYTHRLFVAEHGSWNRSKKVGYRVMMGEVRDNRVVNYVPFVEGWLRPDESVTGRPVDLLQLPDGSLLISDDHNHRIYRVTYYGK